MHVGIVTGIYDEGRATQFFRGLGYRSRGVGAAGLGRRLYIGPFTSQGALDEAIAVAREAGFITPYAASTPNSDPPAPPRFMPASADRLATRVQGVKSLGMLKSGLHVNRRL